MNSAKKTELPPVWTWEEWMRTRPLRAALSRAVAPDGARRPVNPNQEKLRARLRSRAAASAR